MTIAAIIVAAGRGRRAAGPLPKQYQQLAGIPVLARSIEVFARHPQIGKIIVVVNSDDLALFAQRIKPHCGDAVHCVSGGETRADSVFAGIAAAEGAQKVLIHDAARPLVTQDLISKVVKALETHSGAAPALAVSDALWQGADDRVVACVPRDGLYRAQTPQGFQRETIMAAHAAHIGGASDDVEVALAAGLDVAIIEGEETNLKITYASDFQRAERILGHSMDIRCGNGFDVHAFCEGNSVTLCGVTLPFSHGLLGHSDADVGMHALTDAIFGALAEGDIGQHFPPSEARWKNAASDLFLGHAVARVQARGYRFGNADVTLICEAPKIGPHAGEMRAALAGIMEVDMDRISVKATTTEKLGFTGRGEGIAAMATVTLVKS